MDEYQPIAVVYQSSLHSGLKNTSRFTVSHTIFFKLNFHPFFLLIFYPILPLIFLFLTVTQYDFLEDVLATTICWFILDYFSVIYLTGIIMLTLNHVVRIWILVSWWIKKQKIPCCFSKYWGKTRNMNWWKSEVASKQKITSMLV